MRSSLLATAPAMTDDFGLPAAYRPRQYSAIWEQAPRDWRPQLAAALDHHYGGHTRSIFFRADDIGVGGQAFHCLCQLFRSHNVPLAMAVIPAWLSAVRIEQIFTSAPLEEPLWGWHQHGWRHTNWQPTGKKCEFGEERPIEKQWSDICRGRQKMIETFGPRFLPVFTPPWNRVPGATLRILEKLDFKAISITGAIPRLPGGPTNLRNLRIQVDLHTRKAKDGEADFHALLAELSAVLARRKPVGIMIHHQRMTPFAFEFLDELLHLLRHGLGAAFPSFRDLLEDDHHE